MGDNRLQHGFSETYAAVVFDTAGRQQKAMKTVAVVGHHLRALHDTCVLDIGCAAGFTTRLFSERFSYVVGVDIDRTAIGYAARYNNRANIAYGVMDSMRTAFRDESFDVIVCAHVYEHVPDARRLVDEIHRLLKPGGICYFAAGNRLRLIEPHYGLPLLSVVPKSIAHLYLRILKRGRFYYENHKTYWGLKRLVSQFNVVDYTVKIVQEPERFNAIEMVQPNSFKQRLALVALKCAYWLCPTYIWILKK